ncbi:MAG: hypothetical protein FRX48_09094 [Lasallia pustulata]|uniref:Glycosyltransferase family 4 protein n=1 Tax=Lasallia pustulata TaxID=136370 RepID=A0A5M8PDM5_9LECA|nr:MAG: hypothetical protein FRX48_09094 [Lasallia pustulata]
MRICIVNEFFYPDNTGGTGTVLSDLVCSLREIDPDLEIDVVTSTNLYRRAQVKLPAFEDWNGVRIYRLATPHPNSLPMALRLGANLHFCVSAFVKLLTLRSNDTVLVGPPRNAPSRQAVLQRRKTPLFIVYDLERTLVTMNCCRPGTRHADLLASADSFVTLAGHGRAVRPFQVLQHSGVGRPVLATVSPLSEVARVIDEAQAGVHMEQSATDALAAAVVRLSEHPAEAERMATTPGAF